MADHETWPPPPRFDPEAFETVTEAATDRQYNASALVALAAAVLLTVSVVALSINLALNGGA